MKNAPKHHFSVSYKFSLLFLTETEYFLRNRKHFININLYFSPSTAPLLSAFTAN